MPYIRLLILTCLLLFVPLQVRAQVAVSEVLWMGSDLSSTDEWFELAVQCDASTQCNDIDISGWSVAYLNSSGIEATMLTFPAGTRVLANVPLVVARKDAANSRVAAEPGVLSSTVSLPNTKLLLKLLSASGVVIDTVDDGIGAPFAGQNPSGGAKASMERIDLLAAGNDAVNWRTATESTGFDDGSAMFGTPGALPQAVNDPASGTGAILPAPLAADTGSGGVVVPPVDAGSLAHVGISAVLANPAGKDEVGEWVELRNLGSASVSFAGWKLVGKGATTKAFALDGLELPAAQTVRLSYAQTQLLLTNTKYTVGLVDPHGVEVSAVSWEDADEGRIYRPNLFSERTLHATVSRVIDGDTLEVVFDTEPTPDGTTIATVRLIGIDAPESVHPTKPVEPYGLDAANVLRALLEKKNIELQFDTTNWDAYGRLLAYVVVDGQVLAQERLLSNGLARVYPNYPYTRKSMFEEYEARAKALKLGLWSVAPVVQRYETVLPPSLAVAQGDRPVAVQPILPPAFSGSVARTQGWSTLRIAEVHAHPGKGLPEWLELANDAPFPVHTSGLRLRIGSGPKAKLARFPDAVLSPGSYTVFSDQDMKLTLRDTGNSLALVGTGSAVLFSLEYPKLKTGTSWIQDGHTTCIAATPTPAASGGCTIPANSTYDSSGVPAPQGAQEHLPASAIATKPKKSSGKRKGSTEPVFSQQVLASLRMPQAAVVPLSAGAVQYGPWQVFTFLLACVSLVQGTLFCVIAWKSGLLTAATKLGVG